MSKKIIAVFSVVILMMSVFVACGKKVPMIEAGGREYPLATDAEGNTILNHNGEIGVYVTDSDGKYLKDQNGDNQINWVTFPDQYISDDSRKLETPEYVWTLPEGWTFDGKKAVKDGTEGNIYIRIVTVDEEGKTPLDIYVDNDIAENEKQVEEVKKTYPDAGINWKEVNFSSASLHGQLVNVYVKDNGKVMHNVESIYFYYNQKIYDVEYASLDGYYDETVDLLEMMKTFTMKDFKASSTTEPSSEAK